MRGDGIVIGLLLLSFIGGPLLFLQSVGPASAPEAAATIAVALAGAVAAHLFIGVTRRPLLVMAMPMLTGWLVERTSGLWPLEGLWPLAAQAAPIAVAAVCGAALGAVVALFGVSERKIALAAVTVALSELAAQAVGQMLTPDGAGSDLNATDAAILLSIAGLLMIGCLRIARSPVAAGFFLAKTERDAIDLGFQLQPALLGVGLVAGLAGGVAGYALAAIATEPPGAFLTLIFAAAVWLGGGLFAATLAAVGGLWLVPELAGRAIGIANFEMLAALLAVGATLVFRWYQRRKASNG